MGVCPELLFQVFGRYLLSVSMSIVLGGGEFTVKSAQNKELDRS